VTHISDFRDPSIRKKKLDFKKFGFSKTRYLHIFTNVVIHKKYCFCFVFSILTIKINYSYYLMNLLNIMNANCDDK